MPREFIENIRATNGRVEASGILNMVIWHINANGRKKGQGAILYLGQKQKAAMGCIGDSADLADGKFYGWPVVFVCETSYVHLAAP